MRALVLVVATLLGGCFAPDYPNGGLVCAARGKACPDGYHCASNGACWRNGQDPAPPSSGWSGVYQLGAGGGPVSNAEHQGALRVGEPISGGASSSDHSAQFGLLPASQSK